MEIMSIEAYEFDVDDPEELAKRKSQIEEDLYKKISDLHNYYQNSELKCNSEDIHPDISKEELKNDKTQYKAPFCVQFWLLLFRDFKDTYRNPQASYLLFFTAFFMAIIMLLIFGQLGHDEQSIQTRNGVIFLSLIILFFQLSTGLSLLFPTERNVVMREQSCGMYNIFSYFLSKVIGIFPVVFIFVSILDIILYFSVKMNTNGPSHFFIFYSFSILFAYCSMGIGLAVGAAVSTGEEAIDIVTLIMLPFMLCSGYFVNLNLSIPVMKAVEYISIVKYGLQVYMINEYNGLYLSCRPSCDPIKDLNITQTINESVLATACVGFGFYMLSLLILYIRSRSSI